MKTSVFLKGSKDETYFLKALCDVKCALRIRAKIVGIQTICRYDTSANCGLMNREYFFELLQPENKAEVRVCKRGRPKSASNQMIVISEEVRLCVRIGQTKIEFSVTVRTNKKQFCSDETE